MLLREHSLRFGAASNLQAGVARQSGVRPESGPRCLLSRRALSGDRRFRLRRVIESFGLHSASALPGIEFLRHGAHRSALVVQMPVDWHPPRVSSFLAAITATRNCLRFFCWLETQSA